MTLNKSAEHDAAFRLNGTVKIDVAGNVTWTGLFVVIGGGVHPDIADAGFWVIGPPTGPVAVAGGTPRALVAAAGMLTGGVPLNSFESLWYRLPIEATQATVQANFLIVPFGEVFDPDENWVMVMSRDNANSFRSGTGDTYSIGSVGGPADMTIDFHAKQARTETFNGIQVLCTSGAYGFTGRLRRASGGGGVERRPPVTDIDMNVANPVGTVVRRVDGTPSGRVWRVAAAADFLAQFGDLSRSVNPLNAATPLFDLAVDEALYWVPETRSWVVVSHAETATSGFQVPADWITVASRSTSGTAWVFGDHHLAPGDFVCYDETSAVVSNHIRSAVMPIPIGLATAAWTPQNLFTVGGAPGPNGQAPTSYGAYVSWPALRGGMIGMSYGASNSGNSGGSAHVALRMPSVGLQIPVIGTGSTRVVDGMGVPLAEYETLWYVPPASSPATAIPSGLNLSVDSGWVITTLRTPGFVPRNAVKVAQYVGEINRPQGLGAAPTYHGLYLIDSPGCYVWFLGETLHLGFGPAPTGNLGAIGTTQNWRPFFLGAPGGATGWAANMSFFPGAAAGVAAAAYRLAGRPGERTLLTRGFIKIAPASVTLVAPTPFAFLPGVWNPNAVFTGAVCQVNLNGNASPSEPASTSVDVRLVNATVGGVQGAQLSVVNVYGPNVTVANGQAWLDVRALNGTPLD